MKKNLIILITIFFVFLLFSGCNKKNVDKYEETEISVLFESNGTNLAHGGPYYLKNVTRPDDVTKVTMDYHDLPYTDSEGRYYYYNVSNNGAIDFYAKARSGYVWSSNFSEKMKIKYRVRY